MSDKFFLNGKPTCRLDTDNKCRYLGTSYFESKPVCTMYGVNLVQDRNHIWPYKDCKVHNQ